MIAMHPKFAAFTSSLDYKLHALLTSTPLTFGQLPTGMSKAGVYLFTEHEKHLYVGRSNRLRARYFLHCRPGSRQNQASFAYKLARESLGITGRSYVAGPMTRSGLAASEDFMTAFDLAKLRVQKMAYRHVEETDQTRQALLEAYCAIVLESPYNDFDTH